MSTQGLISPTKTPQSISIGQSKLGSPAPAPAPTANNNKDDDSANKINTSPLKNTVTHMEIDLDSDVPKLNEIESSDSRNDENDEEITDNDGFEDPLVKLSNIELLPELYNLIHSLQKGELQAKDFDNNAGNIRLKLSNIRQILQDIEGIEESDIERKTKIENLKNNNNRKKEFINKLKSDIKSELK